MYKLFFHSLIVVSLLTVASLIGTDIVSWIVGHPIENSKQLVFFIAFIWVLFAAQHKAYRISHD